jgi:hypothetical protein
MPCPLLTPARLNAGIKNFLSHRLWRRDFHNHFYTNITNPMKMAGGYAGPSAGAYFSAGRYGPTFWHDIIGELGFWKALRPHPIATFKSPVGLPGLTTAYHAIGAGLPHRPLLPVANPPQILISNLFNAAIALKPSNGPSVVFASKCCHMLLPWEYPISDGKFSGVKITVQKMLDALEAWDDLSHQTRGTLTTVLGNPKSTGNIYWSYRQFILLAWDTLPPANQAALISILDAAILAAGMGPVWVYYPYRTRIPELCLA